MILWLIATFAVPIIGGIIWYEESANPAALPLAWIVGGLFAIFSLGGWIVVVSNTVESVPADGCYRIESQQRVMPGAKGQVIVYDDHNFIPINCP
jgi:hypothetical protein